MKKIGKRLTIMALALSLTAMAFAAVEIDGISYTLGHGRILKATIIKKDEKYKGGSISCRNGLEGSQ